MTKPSYEELERELAEWRSSATADTLERHQEELGREIECRAANQDRVRELYAELLRVRGLLQRWRTNGANSYANYFANEMEAILAQGAESADIGKLDTADKSECPLCNYANAGESYPDVGKRELKDGKWVHRNEYYPSQTSYDKCWLPGSAETGGEKAAPRKHWAPHGSVEICVICKCAIGGEKGCDFNCACHDPEPANFPRSSQNQTASSGVEGAHEGTTADEKAGSREPEKLNNAQKKVVELGDSEGNK